jgi:hypothetical protein
LLGDVSDAYNIFVENSERDCLGDLGKEGRIIL